DYYCGSWDYNGNHPVF
nr:immunoglobulin light chain junction region [Macaca mulatta]MOW17604.1 immunoglobulin light chain junction region [Macaca mulatta]